MTVEQTAAIMDILETAYPAFYSGRNAPDRGKALALWSNMFSGDSAAAVAAAVKALITSSPSTYPPTIGAVKEKMLQLSRREEMTEFEAWGLVSRAVSNGLYGAEEKFEKLPPLVQRLVGSPSQLRDWAMLDRDELQTVIASNFQRSYRQRAQSERDFLKLPQDVRDFISKIGDGMQLTPLVGEGSCG